MITNSLCIFGHIFCKNIAEFGKICVILQQIYKKSLIIQEVTVLIFM